MAVVYKYPLERNRCFTVDIPHGAVFLDFGQQGGELFLWALVIPKNAIIRRTFRVVATGEDFDSCGMAHVGTTHERGLVFHVFAERVL